VKIKRETRKKRRSFLSVNGSQSRFSIVAFNRVFPNSWLLGDLTQEVSEKLSTPSINFDRVLQCVVNQKDAKLSEN
jgi:hypothetical protein